MTPSAEWGAAHQKSQKAAGVMKQPSVAPISCAANMEVGFAKVM